MDDEFLTKNHHACQTESGWGQNSPKGNLRRALEEGGHVVTSPGKPSKGVAGNVGGGGDEVQLDRGHGKLGRIWEGEHISWLVV